MSFKRFTWPNEDFGEGIPSAEHHVLSASTKNDGIQCALYCRIAGRETTIAFSAPKISVDDLHNAWKQQGERWKELFACPESPENRAIFIAKRAIFIPKKGAVIWDVFRVRGMPNDTCGYVGLDEETWRQIARSRFEHGRVRKGRIPEACVAQINP